MLTCQVPLTRQTPCWQDSKCKEGCSAVQILNNERTGDYTAMVAWFGFKYSTSSIITKTNFTKSCVYPILCQMKYLLTLQEFEIFMSLNDTFCSIKFDKKKKQCLHLQRWAMVESNHHTNEPGICFLIRFGRTDLIYAFGTDCAFIFRCYQHEATLL